MTASKLISQLGFLQGMASTLDISGNLASLDIADDSIEELVIDDDAGMT